jgi:hypothetical protein
VVSLNNQLLAANELTELVARHRTVRRTLSLPYRHYGAIASAKKNAENRELVVLSTTGRSWPS